MKQLLIMMVALTLGATSCQKANVEPLPNGQGDGTKSGKQVEVMLNLSVAPTKGATTKGADAQTFTSDALDVTYSNADPETTKSTTELTPNEDSRVINLWIVQFNKSDGKANGKPVYWNATAVTNNLIQSGSEVGIPLKLTVADTPQVIYVMANSGDVGTPADEAALNAMMRSVGTEYTGNMLMLSRIEVPSVSAANNTILSGTLERLFAKVKLNLKNEFPDFEVGYVQLKNVAAGAYFRTAQTGSVNFPAVATNSHRDYPAEEFYMETYVYYVPENLRTTTGTVNSDSERTLDKTDGKATYLEIGGYHMVGSTVTPVTYRLPLGDVETSIADFNVRRNRTYTLDVTLKGANTVDQRITTAISVTISPVATPSIATPANCFMVAPGGTVKFDARIRGNGGNVAGTGLATAIAPVSMKLEWQDATGLISNANSSTGVIPLSSGLATVQTTAGKTGNAVVAAYSGADGAGEILWSWHIWVTDYNLNYKLTGNLLPPNSVYTAAAMNGQVHTYGPRYLVANPGKVIMDRNLGATQTGTYTSVPSAADAPKAFGQLYQWGRKDPLGQAASTSAFAPWYNAAGTAVTSANTAGPVGGLPKSD